MRNNNLYFQCICHFTSNNRYGHFNHRKKQRTKHKFPLSHRFALCLYITSVELVLSVLVPCDKGASLPLQPHNTFLTVILNLRSRMVYIRGFTRLKIKGKKRYTIIIDCIYPRTYLDKERKK